MVGVGSGSALNAFNIGQAATPPTAIGQAIKGIVDNAEKQGLLESQSAAQTAGSMASEAFKFDVSNQPKDIIQIDPSGKKNVFQVPGRTEIQGSPQQINIGGAIGEQMRPPPGPDESFVLQNGQLIRQRGAPSPSGTEFVDVPGLGSIDPNAELTAEQEAAIRKALGL